MTQEEKILRHLEDYGTITQMEAFQDYGIMRLGARVWDLKHKGHQIETQMKQGVNRYGEPTRWAQYYIVK